MPIFLVSAEQGRQIAIDKAVMFIGRHRDCDVVLKGSRKISRKHCCIAQVNREYVVRELGSLNGVFVNGKRVARECPLQIGDTIAFGDQSYVVRGTEDRKGDKTGSPASATEKTVKKPKPAVDLSQDIPVSIPESNAAFKLRGADGKDSEAATFGEFDEDEMAFLDDLDDEEEDENGSFFEVIDE